MDRSSLKILIENGRRLFPAEILIKYRYETNGERVDQNNAGWIDFYGVNEDGATPIGRHYFTTDSGYIAEEKCSVVITGLTRGLWNYIYYEVSSNIDDFKMDGIKINMIKSQSGLVGSRDVNDYVSRKSRVSLETIFVPNEAVFGLSREKLEILFAPEESPVNSTTRANLDELTTIIST